MNKKITEKVLTISPGLGIINRMANINRISLLARVSGFVSGIIGHYVRLQEPWLVTTLVFKQWGTGDNVLNSYHTHIEPRLNFTLLQWYPGPAGSPGRLAPSLRRQAHIELTAPESIVRNLFSRSGVRLLKPAPIYGVEWTAPEPIVRRLFSSSERIEIRPRTPQVGLRKDSYRRTMTEAAKPAVESEYLPVPRIVHRTRATEPERSDYHPQDNSTVQDLMSKQKKAQKVQPPAIPSMDVNRLTEQVIREIDRRIASQRERMGRP